MFRYQGLSLPYTIFLVFFTAKITTFPIYAQSRGKQHQRLIIDNIVGKEIVHLKKTDICEKLLINTGVIDKFAFISDRIEYISLDVGGCA